MPNPIEIGVTDLNFSDVQKAVLHTMMNNPEDDYSTADEIAHSKELSVYPCELVKDAIVRLNQRKFLLNVKKPYGCVYAVNKLYISNMEFVYGGGE